MSNPNIVPLPLPDDDRDERATVDVDGETVLDPDFDDSQVDSASADRLASEEGTGPDAVTAEDDGSGGRGQNDD